MLIHLGAGPTAVTTPETLHPVAFTAHDVGGGSLGQVCQECQNGVVVGWKPLSFSGTTGTYTISHLSGNKMLKNISQVRVSNVNEFEWNKMDRSSRMVEKMVVMDNKLRLQNIGNIGKSSVGRSM